MFHHFASQWKSNIVMWHLFSAPHGFCNCVGRKLLADTWFSDEFASIRSKQHLQPHGLYLFVHSSTHWKLTIHMDGHRLRCYACRFNRIDILEKLLNMENIDLSAEFVILSAFCNFYFNHWVWVMANCSATWEVFCCNFDWFFVETSNREQSATACNARKKIYWRYCLSKGLNTILFVLLIVFVKK